jgi:hypothetical protein
MVDSSDRFLQDANALLNDIWGKREQGLLVPNINWDKPARREDVLYLLSRYPYLQLISTEPNFPEVITPQFVTADSGWIIHDYGDAMSASPGTLLFGAEEEEGRQGRGTIIKQLFDTAYAMMNLAIEKNWPGAEIIAGTALMQWSAWMAAQDFAFTLEGYTPSEQDKAKRKRIEKLRQVTDQLKPAAGFGRQR